VLIILNNKTGRFIASNAKAPSEVGVFIIHSHNFYFEERICDVCLYTGCTFVVVNQGRYIFKVSSPVCTEGLGHAASEMEVPFLASLLYESKKSEESDVVTFASYQA